ncbi:hypothetical protein AAUPMC_12371, partial [Pasteurella multocida subsp. multocida str. Anand1_cattle]
MTNNVLKSGWKQQDQNLAIGNRIYYHWCFIGFLVWQIQLDNYGMVFNHDG